MPSRRLGGHGVAMTVHDDDVDRPEVVVEVRAAFDAYEAALLANDIDAIDGWFWRDGRAVRFGIADRQYGYDEIAAWRATAAPVPADRVLTRVCVTTFGADVATVDCEFRNGDAGGIDAGPLAIGRQSQTWVRTDDGWRITSAHVSMI